jgi:predicted GTPase
MIDNLIEGVTAGLIKRLGIDPAQIVAGFNGIIRDAAAVKTELFAAKAGFINTAGAFKAQLDRIENNQAEILRLLKQEPEIHDQQGRLEDQRGKDAA